MSSRNFDSIVIGGGFYGASLAVRLARDGLRTLLLEKADTLLAAASAVNQARVHTGFHYPRNFVTAQRSLHNYHRFLEAFPDAVRSDFQMLYAIARKGSKVNAERFYLMFKDMGAPIERAPNAYRKLFDKALIEDVFLVDEFVFDYRALRKRLEGDLAAAGAAVRLRETVMKVASGDHATVNVHTRDAIFSAERVFNCSYSHLNELLQNSGVPGIPVKHELTEIALFSPPALLGDVAITVMDGPFFSFMPFPAEGLHSLTHVRYTPHCSTTSATPPEACESTRSNWMLMHKDASRYFPLLAEARWKRSIFTAKTVLTTREKDDGRPIFLRQHPEIPGFWSVLGSKIDNVFDLFAALGLPE